MASSSDDNIDDSLYSRQRYVLGDQAMRKLNKTNVLLVNIGGLGVEIAKNIILAGVKSLTVYDETECKLEDLGVQFFINEEEIQTKKSRASASVEKLRELNPHVCVKVSTFNVFAEDLAHLHAYNCIVMTETDFRRQISINEFCRAQNPPIHFISSDVRGVFSYTFCDFSDSFSVTDSDGEDYKDIFIGSITNASPAVVGTLESRLHGLQSGDTVLIKDVNGMTQLNKNAYTVTYLTPYTFSIDCDTMSFKPYEHGGVFVKQKVDVTMHFHSLQSQLENPSVLINDLSKLEAPSQCLNAFQTLYKYEQQGGLSTKDFDKFLSISQSVGGLPASEEILRAMLKTCNGMLAPLCAATGGVVSQEVLKAVTGKFTPLNQFLLMDAVELVGDDSTTETVSRYFYRDSCLSRELTDRLQKPNLFMVGCGAIGCEFLKNFALLGCCSNESSTITITDNDLIEKSNLNRQFLFRPKDIQKPKSLQAAAKVLEMNPDMKITARQDKVCSESEAIFDNRFFGQQSIVVNALDNVQARRYVDSRCVSTCRPLIETGTMGSKGHVQVVVPHLTETYSSQRDPVDEDVPYCTLKSFPQTIEHTIQWAKDKFTSLFTLKPEKYNKFWAKHNSEISQIVQKFETTNEFEDDFIAAASMLKNKPATWKDCLRLTRNKFQTYFTNKALQLLDAFPLDTRLTDGTLFWQSPKRPPQPITFNSANQLHLDFVISFAKLTARVYGIPLEDTTDAKFIAYIDGIEPMKFVPSKKKIVTNEGETVDQNEPGVDKVSRLMQHLQTSTLQPGIVHCEEFEKDDDENSHIDFITATSNLRAAMYGIEAADRYQTKRIAGRIIPAIATTTATIAGLATIELLKVLAAKPIDNLKNCFLNLALPMVVLSQPGEAPTTKIKEGLEFTCWDRWTVKGEENYTLQQFIDHFKVTYGLLVTGVCVGVKMVYMKFMPAHAKRLPQTMRKLLKPSSTEEHMDLIVSFQSEDENGDDLPAPPVRYYFST